MAKGDGFAVCTMKKQSGGGGGLSAHIDREVYDAELDRMIPFRPASVRDDSRTILNRECIESTVIIGRTQAIWNRLQEAGFSRKKDDKKEGKRKTRKLKDNAVIALCFVCTSDEETMKKLEAEGKLDEWIKKTIGWFQKEFGKENVVSAVLHMDETTPHLHITVVPITDKEAKERKVRPKFDDDGAPIHNYERDENGNIILDDKGRATIKKRAYKKQKVEARLSAKDICNPGAMTRWQTDYAKAVESLGLKRGKFESKQANVAPAVYNLQQINGQLVAVEKEVQEQEAIKKANAKTIEQQENAKNKNEITLRSQDAMMKYKSECIIAQNEELQQARSDTTQARQEEKVAIASRDAAIKDKYEAASAAELLRCTSQQQAKKIVDNATKKAENIVENAKATAQVEAAAIINASKNEIEKAKKEKQQIIDETDAAKKKLATANTELEKWGAMVFDEKSIMYPNLTEMTTADGRTFREILEEKVNELVEILNMPIGTFQKHDNWKVERNKEAKAIVSELEDALFGPNGVDTAHKKAILQLGKDLYSDAKSKISNIYKENERLKNENRELKSQNQTLQNNYSNVQRQNTILKNDLETERTANTLLGQELEREKLATDEHGKHLEWICGPKKGLQLTNKEYQKWLREQFEAKKKELESEKAERLKELAEMNRQREKEKQEMANERQAHKRHIREIKDFLIAAFSLDMRKMIQIVIKHWKAELKEFARDAMNEIKDILFREEPKIDGRKTYVSDAFAWAKVFASLDEDENWIRDESKLEPLREDAMRIADGTWESYREELTHKEQRTELFNSAVAALVEMGNNSYQRHLNQEQADTIETFIQFDGGDRKQLCDEIWGEAKYHIKSNWRDGTFDALNELRTGELYGPGYGKGQSV